MEKMKEISQAIKKFNRFLITSHINPEGDSLGSQVAIAGLLRHLKKEFLIIDNDKVPEHLSFLPDISLIQNTIDRLDMRFDAAIVLDCPNLNRTGKVKSLVEKTGFIINIDHHVSNENFGNVNWVEKDASSTGEMVYLLYKTMGCPITKEAALSLYISILTDTGSFNYENTSQRTHEIVSSLMASGIKPYDVSKSVYENKSVGSMKLLGMALSRIDLCSGEKVAYMSVRKADFEQTGTRSEDCENFVNFARSIKGVQVAVFFREDVKGTNLFHVSFRSKGKVDVNKIASSFGGGGHSNASGCTITGDLEGVKEKVLKRVRDEL